MNDLEVIEQHILIRDTVGYELLEKIDVYDMPNFLSFLKIVDNYNKMNKLY
jgi:hypothetical protein